MWVNFDYIARTGTQASLDFFHLSPAGIANFKASQGTRDLNLQPVVRILTTTAQLLALLDDSEPIAEQLAEATKQLLGGAR